MLGCRSVHLPLLVGVVQEVAEAVLHKLHYCLMAAAVRLALVAEADHP